MVREKTQAARKIQSIKTQFRQAAANLKALLKCQQICTFSPDRTGLSLRARFIIFLLKH